MFRTNGTDKKTVDWTYKDGEVSATTTLDNVAYNYSDNFYTWSFSLQNETELELNITLDVAGTIS